MIIRSKYYKFIKTIIILLCTVIITFLIFPLVYSILWSFTGERGVVSILNRFTLQWFSEVFFDYSWMGAILVSSIYAIISSTLSLTLVIIYYYYSFWYKNFYRMSGYLLIILPLFFPLLIYALALKILSNNFIIPEGVSIIIGHTVIITPIQYLIIEGSNEKINRDWLFSSRIMGAEHIEIIRNIILPNISTTLLVAWLCGFFYSFDELVISNFLIDSGNITVPKKIWLEINRDINPSSAVVYTTLLYIFLCLLLIIFIYRKFKIKMKNKKTKKNRLFLFQDIRSAIYSGSSLLAVKLIVDLFYRHFSIIALIVSFIVGVIIYEFVFFAYHIFKWGNRIIDKIYMFRKEQHFKFRNLATNMVTHNIDKVLNDIRRFFNNGGGIIVSISESVNLNELLFELNKGYYFGTDSNVPSKFKDYYPSYLTDSQNLVTSSRIILANTLELEKDFNENTDDFIEFIKWHRNNNVILLLCDRDEATRLVRIMQLKNTDIGIWDDDYVVIFKPISSDKILYWFKSYATLDETKKYVKYYLTLINQCKKIELLNGRLQFNTISENSINTLSLPLKKLWKI